MIIRGNALSLPLASASVQCVVTSPPYWGLRKYAGDQESVWGGDAICRHDWQPEVERPRHGDDGIGGSTLGGGKLTQANSQRERIERSGCSHCGAWRGAYGLEPTVEMYVDHSVQILREVRRVLRKDGVCFWNVGDSYCGSWGNFGARDSVQRTVRKERFARDAWEDHNGKPPMANPQISLKPKDLCLIPFRVALAAQADGWWVRSVIIWAKPNPMPESVRDRPTDAYEHILMLTKSERYYWDAESVKENGTYGPGEKRYPGDHKSIESGSRTTAGLHDKTWTGSGTRNLRNVWTFPTQPYPEAHFATFPERLPEICIKASTSERGCCPKCGTNWVRVIERQQFGKAHSDTKFGATMQGGPLSGSRQAYRAAGLEGPPPPETLGWRPSCSCNAGEPVPCTVLDPFGGSGTTARVALELNRRPISVDLAYQGLARKRTKNVQRQLLAVSS